MSGHIIVYIGTQAFVIPETTFDEPLPDDGEFWEPVKVTLDKSQLKFDKGSTYTCGICMGRKRVRYTLRCCEGDICKYCSINWFTSESVCCPYCRKDLRELLNG